MQIQIQRSANLSPNRAICPIHSRLAAVPNETRGETLLHQVPSPEDTAKHAKTCAIIGASFTSFVSCNPFQSEVGLPKMIRHMQFVCVFAVAPLVAQAQQQQAKPPAQSSQPPA